MEYLEKLKVYGDQVKNVVVKSMVDTAHGGQKMLKDVLPGNLVTREFEVGRSVEIRRKRSETWRFPSFSSCDR